MKKRKLYRVPMVTPILKVMTCQNTYGKKKSMTLFEAEVLTPKFASQFEIH